MRERNKFFNQPKVSKPKKRRNYINNKSLVEHIKTFKETGKISDYLAVGIMKICENYSKKAKFNQYTYRDEMVSDAIVDCIAAVKNFNPEKTENAFAYFSMIAFNAFLRRIQKEKKETYIKHKNYQNSFIEETFDEDMIHAAPMRNEFSDEIIRDFEEKNATLKKKSLTKKAKPTTISPLEAFIEDRK